MHTQAEPRVRKRLPCGFTVSGARHNGLVLNLSPGGLFIQTSVPARRGDGVAVDLVTAASDEPLLLDARVVWKRVVASHLRTLAEGGMGLQIERAPEAWYSFLPAALGGEASGGAALPSFRVRVVLVGQQRSRSLVIQAPSEDEARRRALLRVGSGWKLLELRRED